MTTLEGSSNVVFDITDSWTEEEEEVFSKAAQVAEIVAYLEDMAKRTTVTECDLLKECKLLDIYEDPDDIYDAGLHDGEVLMSRDLLKILNGDSGQQ